MINSGVTFIRDKKIGMSAKTFEQYPAFPYVEDYSRSIATLISQDIIPGTIRKKVKAISIYFIKNRSPGSHGRSVRILELFSLFFYNLLNSICLRTTFVQIPRVIPISSLLFFYF